MPETNPEDVNLISWWELNEESGERADSHGVNNLSDINTVLFAAGKVGNAADFELTNSEELRIADGDQTGLDIAGDFTIAFWMKLEQLPSTPGDLFMIVNKGDRGTNDRSYIVYLTAIDEIGIFVSDDGTAAATHQKQILLVRLSR